MTINDNSCDMFLCDDLIDALLYQLEMTLMQMNMKKQSRKQWTSCQSLRSP